MKDSEDREMSTVRGTRIDESVTPPRPCIPADPFFQAHSVFLLCERFYPLTVGLLQLSLSAPLTPRRVWTGVQGQDGRRAPAAEGEEQLAL